MADNERIWAQRFAGALGTPPSPQLAAFDQDLLAQVRNYAQITYASAIWSLHRGHQEWNSTSEAGLRAGVVLHHPERGELTALEAIRTVVHDCHHHLWDIHRIINNAQPAR